MCDESLSNKEVVQIDEVKRCKKIKGECPYLQHLCYHLEVGLI